MKKCRNGMLTAGLVTLLCAVAPVVAQNPNPVLATSPDSFPSNEFVTVQNRYLQLQMRVPEVVRTLNVTSTSTTDVGYSNFRGGRVRVSTVEGDPYTQADDGVQLISGPWLTYASIRVGDPNLGETPRVYEAESLYRRIDEPGQEFIVSDPTASNNTVSFAWQIRQDHPTITAIDRANVVLDNAGLTGETSAPLLLVRQSYQLVRDMIRMEVEVTNQSTSDQRVAVEQFVDPQFGGGTNDGTEFFVDGARQGITQEFSFPSTNPADDSALRRIPESFRTFDQVLNPGVVLGGVFSNDEIQAGSFTAGEPSQAMLVQADLAGANAFGYTPVNLNLQNENWAILTRWNTVRITPNTSKRFITYFGLAGATSDFEQPYVLSVEAPFSLDTATGDDPSTTAVEGETNAYRTPNPFTLRAFVNNISNRPLSNIAVSLALPDGFRLVNATDSITKTIATVPVNSEQQVSWLIESLPEQAPGLRVLTVSASGSGLNSKVIEREIGIGALPQLDFPNLTRRLDMISIPFDFQNRDLEHVLQSLGPLGVTGGGNAAVARYNPQTRSYAFFPDPFITQAVPGEGFWLFNGSLADLVLPSDRFEIPPTQQVPVALNPDWNQIGDPYTVPARLYDSTVITSDNATRTFLEAVNSGIIRPVIYEYEPNPTNPSLPGTYTFDGDSNTVLDPWRGYWIRVLQPVTLAFSASNLIGPFRGEEVDLLRLRDGWEFSLSASSGEFRSQTVQLGQDATSRDGYDPRDVDLPPDIRGGAVVRAAVVHQDWGRDSGAYLRDIRSAGGRTARWQVMTECAAPGRDVVLSWNLRSVPGDVQLTLVDLQTGTRRHMRTTSSYAYNTGAFGGTREFQVIATRGSRGALAIPQMSATPGRGRTVGITFNLTVPATVEVVIESPTGRRVRTLETSFAGVEGQNTVGWDGRDDERRPVPAGQYRCRVLVHTPDGQRAIAERIVVLSR